MLKIDRTAAAWTAVALLTASTALFLHEPRLPAVLHEAAAASAPLPAPAAPAPAARDWLVEDLPSTF